MSEANEAPRTCGSCGAENTVNAKFCKKCGTSLSFSKFCQQCGNKLDADSEFCQQCGYKINKTLPMSLGSPSYRMKRLPLGLEILIVFGALGAVYYLYSAIMVFYFANTLLSGASFSGSLGAVGLLWLLLAAILGIVSWGLWTLKEWARKALMIIALLGLIGALIDVFLGLLSIGYSLLILWYISRPHIKSLYSKGQTTTNQAMESTRTAFAGTCPKCGKKGKPGTQFCVRCGSKLEGA